MAAPGVGTVVLSGINVGIAALVAEVLDGIGEKSGVLENKTTNIIGVVESHARQVEAEAKLIGKVRSGGPAIGGGEEINVAAAGHDRVGIKGSVNVGPVVFARAPIVGERDRVFGARNKINLEPPVVACPSVRLREPKAGGVQELA